MSQSVNLEELGVLMKGDSLFLLDIYAGWCHPCKLLDREIDVLEKDLPWLKVVKIDYDKSEGLSDKFGIRSLPLLIFFNGDKELLRIKGFYRSAKLIEEISRAVPHMQR